MLLNCDDGGDSWESLGLQGKSILKEINPGCSLEGLMLKLKLQPDETVATWWEELTHLKKPWCWERLKAGGEGDYRGWDCGMASPTQWTWVWASSESWWWTGKPGALHSMGSQRVGHDWVTELNWLKESSQPRNWTRVSCIAGRFFTSWAILTLSKGKDLSLKRMKTCLKGIKYNVINQFWWLLI